MDKCPNYNKETSSNVMSSLEYSTKALLKKKIVYICSSLTCKVFSLNLNALPNSMEPGIHFIPTTADGKGLAQLTLLAYYQTIYWEWWPLIHSHTFSIVFYEDLGFNREFPRVSGNEDKVCIEGGDHGLLKSSTSIHFIYWIAMYYFIWRD